LRGSGRPLGLRSASWFTSVSGALGQAIPDAGARGDDLDHASGATIEFGHLQHESSVLDYQGGGYHRVAYDELTQFSEQQYLYLFSRMRMRKDFPIRMGIRCASNPGGPGHAWVKQRFITQEAERAVQALGAYQPSPAGLIFWPAPNRAFVPARVADNPSLDINDYVERMRTHLPPVLRERLLNGDWSIVEDAVIRIDWLRYYDTRGEVLSALDVNGKVIGTIDCRQCHRLATIDTAGTSKQKADERKGKPPSWSVCQIWDYWPQTKLLFLRHVWRDRVAWDGLKSSVRHVLGQWQPRRVLIENAHHGPPLAAELKGYTTELVSPIPARARGEEGKPERACRVTTTSGCPNWRANGWPGPAWRTKRPIKLMPRPTPRGTPRAACAAPGEGSSTTIPCAPFRVGWILKAA
jgi:phage terminase large subunit-like protein